MHDVTNPLSFMLFLSFFATVIPFHRSMQLLKEHFYVPHAESRLISTINAALALGVGSLSVFSYSGCRKTRSGYKNDPGKIGPCKNGPEKNGIGNSAPTSKRIRVANRNQSWCKWMDYMEAVFFYFLPWYSVFTRIVLYPKFQLISVKINKLKLSIDIRWYGVLCGFPGVFLQRHHTLALKWARSFCGLRNYPCVFFVSNQANYKLISVFAWSVHAPWSHATRPVYGSSHYRFAFPASKSVPAVSPAAEKLLVGSHWLVRRRDAFGKESYIIASLLIIKDSLPLVW